MPTFNMRHLRRYAKCCVAASLIVGPSRTSRCESERLVWTIAVRARKYAMCIPLMLRCVSTHGKAGLLSGDVRSGRHSSAKPVVRCETRPSPIGKKIAAQADGR